MFLLCTSMYVLCTSAVHIQPLLVQVNDLLLTQYKQDASMFHSFCIHTTYMHHAFTMNISGRSGSMTSFFLNNTNAMSITFALIQPSGFSFSLIRTSPHTKNHVSRLQSYLFLLRCYLITHHHTFTFSSSCLHTR